MFPFFRFVAMKKSSLRALASACILGLILGVALPTIADAVTPAEYENVGVSVPADSRIPSGVIVRNERGYQKALDALVTRPTVLVLSDYRCKTLCGPVLDFVVSALAQSGLKPGDQFSVFVVGLDPRDTADDVRAVRRQHLSDDTDLARATSFFTSDEASIARLTAALGYRYLYDPAGDQFVHPAAAFVLRADRRVSRVLTGVGLSGADMRLALVEAGQGKIGNLSDQVRLLCSAFDPVQGTYTPMISRTLEIASTVTLVLLAGGIGLLALSNRRSA